MEKEGKDTSDIVKKLAALRERGSRLAGELNHLQVKLETVQRVEPGKASPATGKRDRAGNAEK